MKENVGSAHDNKPKGFFDDFREKFANFKASPGLCLTAGAENPNSGKAAISVPGLPPMIVKRIVRKEGLKEEVYLDSVGVVTGGIGHKLSASEKQKMPIGTKLNRQQISTWAQVDMGTSYQAAQNQASKIGFTDPKLVNALFEVNFQLGVNWYTIHKRTWALLLSHKWAAAATEAQDSKWYAQTPDRVKDFQASLRALAGSGNGEISFWDKLSEKVRATAAKSGDSGNKKSGILERAKAMLEGEKTKEKPPENIPPLLSDSQFYSQMAGASAVPLSFLKRNMSAKSSESKYRNSGCYQTCRYTLIQSGFVPQGKSTAKYMVEASFLGKKGTGGFKKQVSGISEEATEGRNNLDRLLEAGMPVIVGVNKDDDRHKGRWTNTHRKGGLSPTDHFVIIVGRELLDDGSLCYRYFDPGRSNKSNGANPKNLFTVKNGYLLAQGYKCNYTLSEVRNTEQKSNSYAAK